MFMMKCSGNFFWNMSNNGNFLSIMFNIVRCKNMVFYKNIPVAMLHLCLCSHNWFNANWAGLTIIVYMHYKPYVRYFVIVLWGHWCLGSSVSIPNSLQAWRARKQDSLPRRHQEIFLMNIVSRTSSGAHTPFYKMDSIIKVARAWSWTLVSKLKLVELYLHSPIRLRHGA
jgi:hypothetical protein